MSNYKAASSLWGKSILAYLGLMVLCLSAAMFLTDYAFLNIINLTTAITSAGVLVGIIIKIFSNKQSQLGTMFVISSLMFWGIINSAKYILLGHLQIVILTIVFAIIAVAVGYGVEYCFDKLRARSNK